MVNKIHTTAKVNGPLYEGFLWAGFAVGTCFVAFRLWVRKKTLHRFFNDDYLAVLAVICFLLTAILQQTQLDHMYELFAFEAGKLTPDLLWMKGQSQLLHNGIAFNILFYTGLWSIKLSFMLFFRRLESGVSKYRYWWWVILIIAIAGWVACIADIQWDCLAYSVANNSKQYVKCGTPSKVGFQQTTFHVNCALDVGTDILILTVPVLLLWEVRISWRKRVVLVGLFSMTVLIMATSIIRVAVVSSKDVPSDMTWLYFWSNIELAVALVVSGLASFRQLYVSSQQERPGAQSTTMFGGGNMQIPQGKIIGREQYENELSEWGSDTKTEVPRKCSSNSTDNLHDPVDLDQWSR